MATSKARYKNSCRGITPQKKLACDYGNAYKEGEGAKTVFVDAPPHNEEIVGEIAAMSDFVIIACRPGFFDLNGIPPIELPDPE